MLPALDGGDDAVWVGGPDERLRIAVGFGDEAMNGSLQLDDRAEHAALQASSGELGEEALDGVEPRGGGRRVVEDEARMPAEPRHHLGMLVGGMSRMTCTTLPTGTSASTALRKRRKANDRHSGGRPHR